MEIQNNEIKIVVPSGMEIDKENSTLECIKFKPIKNELPKTWEEFCKTHPRKREESFIDDISKIREIREIEAMGTTRDYDRDRNILPSKELAEAMLALCQLIQLRDCYNDDWTPDWTNDCVTKYCIISYENIPSKEDAWIYSQILAFKTAELRDQFFKNFKDLIEIAKPLL